MNIMCVCVCESKAYPTIKNGALTECANQCQIIYTITFLQKFKSVENDMFYMLYSTQRSR